MTQLPEKSKRSFTKNFATINLVLAWATVFLGMFWVQTNVSVAALGFVTMIFGLYTGIGHLDYRKVLDTYKPKDDYYGYNRYNPSESLDEEYFNRGGDNSISISVDQPES